MSEEKKILLSVRDLKVDFGSRRRPFHAVKGVSANLGLKGLSEAASAITEEFRPGHSRTLSDAEIAEKLKAVAELYRQTAEGIRRYEES